MVRYVEGEKRNPLWAWGKLRPSIFMPRWASRIELEIISVRVERLQGISEEDAKAEGAERMKSGRGFYALEKDGGKSAVHFGNFYLFARDWFADLWEDINGRENWNANPWVWVVEFKRVDAA